MIKWNGTTRLFGVIVCPQSTLFPAPSAGSVVGIDLETLNVTHSVSVPGATFSAPQGLSWKSTSQKMQLSVPVLVRCSDEPATICPSLVNVEFSSASDAGGWYCWWHCDGAACCFNVAGPAPVMHAGVSMLLVNVVLMLQALSFRAVIFGIHLTRCSFMVLLL